jgi:hypothetical protein
LGSIRFGQFIQHKLLAIQKGLYSIALRVSWKCSIILEDVGNHLNTFPIIRKESTILMLTLSQISNATSTALQGASGNPTCFTIQIQKLTEQTTNTNLADLYHIPFPHGS